MACAVSGALALAGCTLAGEPVPAGPVEVRSAEDGPLPTAQPTVELPPDLGYPSEVPDASEGAFIFAERCVACHAPDGSGVGAQMTPTLVEQGVAVPDFTDAPYVAQKTPAQFFQVITEGNLESLMPPWGQELTEAERWSLAFYLFTLSTPTEALATGQVAYETHCAACHGQTGVGDGPEASGPIPDLTDAAAAVERSPQATFEVVTNGAGAMPGFAETLTEDERWAAVAYSLSLAYASAEPAAPPPDLETAEGTGTVRGQVVNRSTGAPVAEGQEVFLHGLMMDSNGVEEVVSIQTATDALGNYIFEDVPFDRENLVYVADVAYGDVAFNNAGVVVPGETSVLELPISVYDVTQDPSVVSVDTLHVVVSSQSEESVLVAQIYVFSNNSEQVYVSEQAISETRRATVKMPVPPEAVSLAFEDGELGGRFVETADGVLDTAVVLPGPQSHSVVMTYVIPYDGDYTLDIPLYYQTEQVSVLYDGTAMRVQAEGLAPTETGDPNLDQFQILAGEGYASGDEVVITLSRPGVLATSGNLGLIIAGGVAALALVGAGVWWWRRSASGTKQPTPAARRPAPASTAGRQRELMQAIANLDDAYEAGQVAKAEYEARRARLKAELVALVEGEENSA